MIIQWDNLEALKSLLPKYEWKVKCIYIDPPYNTGNEWRVYNDNVNHPKIKKRLWDVVGKEWEDLSRHDKWLCMMYPRLKLLHRLLRDDGVIFVSIDDNEQAHLKLMMDEIFGIWNLIWNLCIVNNLKWRSDDKYVATSHESLVIYHKWIFDTYWVPIPSEYSDEYKFEDDLWKYRLQWLRKRGSWSKRSDRPNLYYPVYYNETQKSISLDKLDWYIEITPKLSSWEDWRRRRGKDTFLQRIEELEINIVKSRNEYDVFQKDYLIKGWVEKRIKPKSTRMWPEFSSEAWTLQLKWIFEWKVFETPKSYKFIEYILEQWLGKDDIILDSFAWSWTTAHAVLNLNKQDWWNRKFILVEMEDYAESITAERVNRVIDGYGEEKKAVEGTWWSYDYYALWEQLFLDEDTINEAIWVDKIREYIRYTETKSESPVAPSWIILWTQYHTEYHFYYDPDGITTLDHAYLATLSPTEWVEQRVIYADLCALDDAFLRNHNIIFKKIPRDISRF